MLIKLPNLTNRIKCYEDFYMKLFKVKTLDGIEVTKVCLTKKNEETLKAHIKKEMRKEHKGITKRYWERSFAMYWLQYSPATTMQDKCKNGYAFIE